MLFKRRFHQGLIDGSITAAFRRWARPRVKAGGRYRRNANGVLEIKSIDEVRDGEIQARDVQRAGYDDRASLLADLGAPRKDTTLFRVAFRYVEQRDERIDRANDASLSASDVAAIAKRLASMDARSKHGPWTSETLALIERYPRTAASQLAKRAGRETLPFKADVRKLKALGLTISFEAGYEVSPRGRAFLKAMRRQRGASAKMAS